MVNDSDNARQLAEEALEQARTLLGEGTMSDREFLETMAHTDEMAEHEDNCGHCGMLIIQAQTARDLLAEGDILDGISKWVTEHRRRWYESKYFKLYQQEQAAGRNPEKAFEERGWEM